MQIKSTVILDTYWRVNRDKITDFFNNFSQSHYFTKDLTNQVIILALHVAATLLLWVSMTQWQATRLRNCQPTGRLGKEEERGTRCETPRAQESLPGDGTVYCVVPVPLRITITYLASGTDDSALLFWGFGENSAFPFGASTVLCLHHSWQRFRRIFPYYPGGQAQQNVRKKRNRVVLRWVGVREFLLVRCARLSLLGGRNVVSR